MPTIEAIKPKNHLVRRVVPIKADVNAQGEAQLPTRLELVRAGSWSEDSNKGMFYILPTDLVEMKANFDARIGTPGNSGQIAVDFSHNDYAEAGCWIHAMEVDGDVLYGTELEFTPTGAAKILGGEFKFISPSFYPGCLGEWCDPEDWSVTARNVVVGAGFTNIPFFKNLQPVKASQNSQEGEQKEQILFVDASSERSNMPTLDEVRVKEVDALTEDDKTLLAENKDKLNADEKVKFGFETTTVVNADANEVQMTDEQKEAMKIQADINSGKFKLVEASAYAALESTVSELKGKITATEEAKVREVVKTHIAAGRIKADKEDKWVERIMADASLADELEAMPSDPSLTNETGADGANAIAASVADEVRQKAKDMIKAAKEENADSNLDMPTAMSKVLASDKDLTARYEAEVRGA